MQELQRSRTSRRIQNYDGCILWIDFSKIAETVKKCGRWTVVEPEGIIESSNAVVVGNRSASEGLKSRANGVATSTLLVGRRVS